MTCSECDKPVHGLQSYCKLHYTRWKRHGDPSVVRSARKDFFDESYFDVIETPEQAYWLGFITADGCVTDNYQIVIQLKESDVRHLSKFADCVKSSAPITVTTKEVQGKVYRGARVRLGSKYMAESLKRLGVAPRKSLTVEPWSGSPELMPAYWRGLFDGDGTISKIHRKASGKTTWTVSVVGSHMCVDGFSQWAREICGSTAQVGKHVNVWQWQVGGTVAPQLLARKLAAVPIWLDRKQELLRELSDTDFGTRYLRTKRRPVAL